MTSTQVLLIAMRALPVEEFSMIGKTISHYRTVGKPAQAEVSEGFQAEDSSLSPQLIPEFPPYRSGTDHKRPARFNPETKILALHRSLVDPAARIHSAKLERRHGYPKSESRNRYP
jgi:hypothetical protein